MNVKTDSAAQSTLESLSIPAPETSPVDLSAEQLLRPAAWVPSFISTETARSLFRKWNPDQEPPGEPVRFLRAFRDLLRRGAALGLRLDRFREISATLVNLEPHGAWTTPFEGVVEEIGAGALRLYISPRAHEHYQRDTTAHAGDDQTWRKNLDMMADGLFYELGVVFPPIDVRGDDTIDANDYRLEWNDLVLPTQRGLKDGRVLVNDTVDRLTLLNVKGEEAINPANGAECATVPADVAEICRSAGLTVWHPGGFAVLGLSAALRSNAAAFVTRALVDLYLLQLEAFDSELITLIEKKIDRDTLVSVLRGLAAEEISIRNLSQILRFCLRHKGTFSANMSRFIVFDVASGLFAHDLRDAADTQTLVDNVRGHLKRYISCKYTRGGNTLVVYLLDPAFESRLRRPAALTEYERQVLLTAVRDEVGNLPPTAQNPVILTTMEIRHRVRVLVQAEFPRLAIVSYQELSPDMNIQPIARIAAEDLDEPRATLLLEELDRRLEDDVSPPAPAALDRPDSEAWVHRIDAIAARTDRALFGDGVSTSAAGRRGARALVWELLHAAAEAAIGSDRRLHAWRHLIAAVARDFGASDELRELLNGISNGLRSRGRWHAGAHDDDVEDGLGFVSRLVQETRASLPEPAGPAHEPIEVAIDELPEARRRSDLSDAELGEDLCRVSDLVDDLFEVQRITLIDLVTVSRAWRKAASLVKAGRSDLRLVATLEVLVTIDPKFPSLGLILALASWFAGDRSAAVEYVHVQLAQSDGAHRDEARALLHRWARSDLVVA